ncbi:MAG: peptidase MA family metallohydrolase, partial [Candidatus Sericytochromatia bacterium]
YVDSGAGAVTDAQLDAFVTAFETAVHPKVTALFGEPARPGVDGDDRVFIVFSPAVSGFERQTDLLGYFWAPDAVPNPASGSHSNQKEVLFMSDRLFGAARVQAYGVLAHEFQHLINFTNKGPRLNYQANEATWLDEGMAMLAAEAAGYGLAQGDRLVASSIADYQAAPEAYSLTDWAGNPQPAFGQSYMFVRYLVDRHGPAVLKALIASDRRGGEAIDAVLAPKGHTFAGLFTDWALTNAWSGTPGTAAAPYRYADLNLTGTYNGVTLPGFRPRPVTGAVQAVPLKPWGVDFRALAIAQPAAWRLRLEAGAGSAVEGAAIATP